MSVAILIVSFLAVSSFGSEVRAATMQQQWENLVAAAKKEGRLSLWGPSSADARIQIPAAFKKRFGITVDYLSGGARRLIPRVRFERRARQYNRDVAIAGSTLQLLLDEDMLEPIRPGLIHPDATDTSKWKLGRLFFVDSQQQYLLRISMYTNPLRVINTTHVKPEDVSWQGLLNPKWKGKISTQDPRGGRGAGAGNATYILYQLGEEYFTRLYKGQQIVFTGDARQQADWLARGTYPIAIGIRKASFARLKKDGFPLMMVPNTPEVPGFSTAGNGYVVLFNRAPHPNAAKLFVNWLLSRDGHEVFNRAVSQPGMRNDLDDSWAEKATILQPGWNYLDTDALDFRENIEPELVKRMQELLGK